MTHYLIVGNGVAGTTAAENIRKLDHDANITIITDEGVPFYWRIRLNEYLAGEIREEELLARSKDWYEDQKIALKLNTRAIGGDADKKLIFTEPGQEILYDTLLMAVGSHSFIPPIEGADKRGVFALRSLQDTKEIAAWAREARDVVLIGGGLLGLEAGNALLKLGKNITVVEFFPRLLPRQLDVKGAGMLQEIMEGMGFSFRLGAKTQSISGENQVEGVLLEGGETLGAQMVIVSAGVRPNLDLAESLGLECDKGIKVDGSLRTNRADIFAAGDVAQFGAMPYGIWPAAMEEGKIAGINMAGGSEKYTGTTMANTLKVVGIDLASAGDIDAEGKLESKSVAGEGIYKKIVLKGNQIVGCIMLGETTGFAKVTKAMSLKQDISQIRDHLIAEGFDL